MSVELVARWPKERAVQVRNILNKISGCHCGDPSAWFRVVQHLLERAETYEHSFYDTREVSASGSPPLPWVEFGAKVPDNWGLLEHGSGVGYSWLTEQGRLVLEFDFGGVPWDEDDVATHPAWSATFGWEKSGNNVWDAYADWAKKELSK